MHRLIVITADRPGLIAELSGVLARKGVNIAAIDGRSVGGDAVLHLTLDAQDAALAALHEAGFRALSEDVVAVKVEDAPGALSRIARRLTEAGLDIRGISTVSRRDGHCLVALSTDDNARARHVVADLLV